MSFTFCGNRQTTHIFNFEKEACLSHSIWNLQRLPPLSTEPNRCERAYVGNTIGQANGVYDKPIDLRFCDYTNEKNQLKGKSLAAALMSDAKFDGADLSEVVMSKAYAVGASFKGKILSILPHPQKTKQSGLSTNFSYSSVNYSPKEDYHFTQ